MELSPGTRVGSFEILAPLGAGGMGSVYRARDTKLGREVAIKIVQDKLLGSHEHLERFEREARAASALNHPNIITIYDIGEYEQAPFIAMELVEGQQLREILKRGPGPLRKLLQIGAQIADGLAAAHERKIVHRDLKPENIMITPDGRVKILDFGLARLQREPTTEDATSDLITVDTPDGLVVGTAAYMSPEQANGSVLDHRSDQFALGTILWEMATGKHPFRRATTFDTLSAVVHDEPPPIEQFSPKIPEPLRWLIKRCLEKDPRERYDSTRDLAHELRTLRERIRESTSAEVLSSGRRMFNPARAVMLAVAILVVLAAALVIPRTRSTAFAGRAQQLPQRKFLAVMPFADLRGTSGSELFARGLAEVVSTQLKKKAGDKLVVIGPGAVSELLARKRTRAQIAKALHANLLLEGSILQSGTELQVNFAVQDTAGTHHAGDTLSTETENVLALQYQIADGVLEGLGLSDGSSSPRETGLTREEDQIAYVQALARLEHRQDQKEIDSAVDALEQLARQTPEAAIVHAALGRAYLYKYTLTQDPSWSDKAIGVSERARKTDSTLAEVHLTIGETHLLRNNAEDAIREFRTALASQPHSADATVGLARALAMANEDKDAERTFQRAIALHPNWLAYYHFGEFYRSLGQFEKAKRMYAEVIRLYPDHSWGYARFGGTQLLLGDFDGAIKTLRRAIAIEPDSYRAHANLGTCYYYLGRYSDAVAAYKRAVEVRPHESLYQANLGDAYRALRQEDKARAAYEKAIALALKEISVSPQNPRAHATLARCYAKTGKLDLARRHVTIAIEQEDDAPEWMVHAAMVANLSGDERGAIEWLRRALAANYHPAFVQSDPTFANLKHLLGSPDPS